MSSDHNLALIETAAAAFWAAFAASFPEVTSGDSQLSGEDEAALAIWAYGEAGDRPTESFHLPVEWTNQARIAEAVQKCMAAASAVLFVGQPVPAVPPLTLDLLTDCIEHVLHFNPPTLSA